MLIDTQPVSPDPPVVAAGRCLGRVDMSDWSQTIEAIDTLVHESVDAGLYSIEAERRIVVADIWDSPSECIEMVAGWQGTRLPDELAQRILASPPPVRIEQEVRLRVLRAE